MIFIMYNNPAHIFKIVSRSKLLFLLKKSISLYTINNKQKKIYYHLITNKLIFDLFFLSLLEYKIF